MAGDWIKMRGALCTNPKVLMIADILGASTDVGRRLSTGFNGSLSEIVTSDVMRDVTLAGLLRVWCATNEHTEDGVWRSSTLRVIDQAAGIPGFGEAMAAAGWAIYDAEAGTVTMPNFLENNAPAKNNARSTAAERQARYRDKKKSCDGTRDVTRDVTQAVTSNAREEKRREEDSEAKASGGTPPMSPDEIIFGYGLPMLTNAGTPEKQARSFLGGLRKAHGADALVDKLRECLKAKPIQPLEWLAAALPPPGAKPAAKPTLLPFAEQERRAGWARWEAMTGQLHPELEKLRQAGETIDVASLRIEHVATH